MFSIDRSRATTGLAVGFAFIATAMYRYLALNGFPNDQFVHLAAAQQMRFGEWPTRDFVDAGAPLQYFVSAAARAVLGDTLLAEAVLIALAFGVASACIVLAATRLSGSLSIGLVAAAVSVLVFPRPYGYPKILLYAAAPLVMMTNGTFERSRLVWLAVFVVVAFLFRHDHGLYLGTASLLAVVLAKGDARLRVRRVATFIACVALGLLPYLVFVHVHVGLGEYLRAGLAVGAAESFRTRLPVLPGWDTPDGRLFWTFHVLPWTAFAVLLIHGFRKHGWDDSRLVVPLAVMAILVNRGFLRDPIAARLADAVVPAVLLGAWLAGRAWRTPSPGRRVAAVVGIVAISLMTAASVSAVADVPEQIKRTGVGGRQDVPALLARKTSELKARFSPRQVPDRRVSALVPFFQYIDRCTVPADRLFVAGFAPEIYVYAGRPFAGGQSTFINGYYESDVDQRRVLERLKRQRVLFAFVPTGDYEEWREAFPLLDTYVHERFRTMTEIPIDDAPAMRVLVNSDIERTGRDDRTGWPCFR